MNSRIPRSVALVAHGGAGARGLMAERPARRRAILAAVERGVELLRAGASALDVVTVTVTAMEDDPWFNAGYGSVLNNDGEVEMDASLMVAPPRLARAESARAGAVAAITRVRNPILLARAVMERTPHLLMVGAGAERLARQARLKICRPEDLITERARERWRRMLQSRALAATGDAHGTVGAVARDSHGEIAAATSTGGMTGKMAGRVGDSAIIGAGVFADSAGGASATGEGEAIMKAALCREAIRALRRLSAPASATRAIRALARTSGAQAGLIIVDSRGRVGWAHNAESMQVAALEGLANPIRHLWLDPI